MDQSLRFFPQFFAAMGAALSGMTMGAGVAYSTVLVPSLMDEAEENLKMDLEEASWIPSLYMLGGAIMSPIGGWVSNRVGRRAVFLGFAFPIACCWVITAYATNRWIIHVVRFVFGALIQFHYAILGVYISETSHKSMRSSFGVLQSLLTSLGMLLMYIGGYFLEWRKVALLGLLPVILNFIAMIFLPETPYWLIEKNREDDARAALTFLRGPDYENMEDELSEIIKKHREKMAEKELSWSFTIQRLTSSAFIRPFCSAGILYGIMPFTGVLSLLVYMINVMEISGSEMDPKLSVMLLGFIRPICAVATAFLFKRVEKKHVFVICAILLGISTSAMATYSLVKSMYPEMPLVATLSWIPLVAGMACLASHSIGIVTTLHILLGESFPTEIRTLSVGIVHSFYSFLFCLSTKSFPWLLHLVQFHGTFYFYSLMALFMAIWGQITIKKNADLSLIEIENAYDSKIKNAIDSNAS